MPKIYALVHVFFGDFEVHEETVAVSFSEEELKNLYQTAYKTVEFQVPFANNQEEINEFENEDKSYYCVRPIDFVE